MKTHEPQVYSTFSLFQVHRCMQIKTRRHPAMKYVGEIHVCRVVVTVKSRHTHSARSCSRPKRRLHSHAYVVVAGGRAMPDCVATTTVSASIRTRGQSNLTKSASRGAQSPLRGHPRGSKVVPLNSCGRVSY